MSIQDVDEQVRKALQNQVINSAPSMPNIGLIPIHHADGTVSNIHLGGICLEEVISKDKIALYLNNGMVIVLSIETEALTGNRIMKEVGTYLSVSQYVQSQSNKGN